MSKSRELTPRDANRVVQFETNVAYQPVITSEEVPYELECSVDRAEALLEEIPHVNKKSSRTPTSGGELKIPGGGDSPVNE